MTHWKQKVAMAKNMNNDNCQCMQNEPQRCKIKVGKFQLITVLCFGDIDETSQGGEEILPTPCINRVKQYL